MLMAKARDKQFWKRVRTNSGYEEILGQIRTLYETSRQEEIPSLKYSSRMRFYADGDRGEFETPYFRRRT